MISQNRSAALHCRAWPWEGEPSSTRLCGTRPRTCRNRRAIRSTRVERAARVHQVRPVRREGGRMGLLIREGSRNGEAQASIAAACEIGSGLCSQIVRKRIWNPAACVPLTCGQEMRDRIIGGLETGCRQGEMQKIRTVTSTGTVLTSRSQAPMRRRASRSAFHAIPKVGSQRFRASDDSSEAQEVIFGNAAGGSPGPSIVRARSEAHRQCVEPEYVKRGVI